MAQNFTLRLNRAAIEDLARSGDARRLMDSAGAAVRDEARRTAAAVSGWRTSAIVHEVDQDADGVYANIGYDKSKPGFVLFFHEVGTSKHGPTPHLRPAIQRRNLI